MAESFQKLVYTRPDERQVITGIKEQEEALRGAADWEEAKKAFERFHEIQEEFRSMCQIAEIRFTLDVRDPFYGEENEALGEMGPRVSAVEHDFYDALLKCPYREEIDRDYGPILLEKLRQEAAGGGDAVTELVREENRLLGRFRKIIGSSLVDFRGGKLPVERLYPYKGDRNREVREAAYRAEGEYFAGYREELEEIFDALVKVRDAQAKALGFSDFAQLCVIRMGRMGYGLEEIAHYREQVKKYWVPAVTKIKEEQRKRLGLKDWKAYDNLLYFPDYNPVPQGGPEEMLKACSRMFHELSRETGEFFDTLTEHGMFDLDAREGKAPGGYCGSVDSERLPFIFSNFNGTTMDIDVLIHESGHAFAAYEAYLSGVSPECREASSETAETHSTAMELLTMPWHGLFFGKDAARYDRFLMERTLTYLPGGCASDEFLTEVSLNPGMSSVERHALWKRLRSEYQPHFSDYGDIPMYGEGQEWLFDSQIVTNPFYFVDYGMARNVSLQLFLLQQKDPGLAWSKYIRFLKAGGTKSFRSLVREIGLEVPFEGESVRHVIEPMLDFVLKMRAE